MDGRPGAVPARATGDVQAKIEQRDPRHRNNACDLVARYLQPVRQDHAQDEARYSSFSVRARCVAMLTERSADHLQTRMFHQQPPQFAHLIGGIVMVFQKNMIGFPIFRIHRPEIAVQRFWTMKNKRTRSVLKSTPKKRHSTKHIKGRKLSDSLIQFKAHRLMPWI